MCMYGRIYNYATGGGQRTRLTATDCRRAPNIVLSVCRMHITCYRQWWNSVIYCPHNNIFRPILITSTITCLGNRIGHIVKKMSIHVRKRFVKVFVWSVALYGSETWVINKAEGRYLESFAMWNWQRLLRISWMEFRTNDSVLNEIGQPRGLLKSIKERRWRLIGHTLRHEEEL